MKAEQVLIEAVDNQLHELNEKLTKREAVLKEFADPFNWNNGRWEPMRVDLQKIEPEDLAAEALK